MDPISFPAAALMAAGAFALGAGLCFVLMHMRFGSVMHEATQRIDRALKARNQANELLLQARRQIELLSKEVEMTRRLRATPKPTPAELAPSLNDDDAPTLVMKRTANGFADTLPFKP